MGSKRRAGPADIITITNEKGGVGKTTISVNLAFYLAQQGYKVLGIDLDGQGNFSSRFVPIAERVGGLRSCHLYMEEMPKYEPLHSPSGVDLIYSLDGDVDLHSIEQSDLSVLTAFAGNIANLCDDDDVIIIDNPPTSGIKMTGSIFVADHIFVPVELAAFAVNGVLSLLDSFARISRATGKEIKPTGFICNKLNTRVDAHKSSLAALRKEVGPLIMRNAMSNRGAVDTAVTQGVAVWDLKNSGAARVAGNEMLLLLEEIAALIGFDVEKWATSAEDSPAEKRPAKQKSAPQKKTLKKPQSNKKEKAK